jgi:hypothetical protein
MNVRDELECLPLAVLSSLSLMLVSTAGAYLSETPFCAPL